MTSRLRSRAPANALAHGLTGLWLSSVAYIVHLARTPDANLYRLQAKAFLDGALVMPSAAQDASGGGP